MKRAVSVAAICALLLAGCGKGVETAAKPEASPNPGAAAKQTQLSATQKQFLTIEAVGNSQAGEALTLPGRITFRPQAQSAVGAPVTGRITGQLVRAGEVVRAGTPLLVIESADASAIRASLDQASTRLTAAEQAYRRQVEMVDKGVGLESERQEADARLKDARAEHDRARQAVALIGAGTGSRVTITAPTNGVVMSIRVAVGATVAPGGEPLLELGDPALLQVVAQVSESDLRHIAIGQEAKIEIPSLSAQGNGRIESISPRVDPDSRRAQVYLALAKRIDGMQAGMLAQIALRIGNDSVVTLPTSAVLIRNGALRIVYVEKQDGTYEAREVQTGRNRDGRIVILSGLSTGERVVVRGALLLDTQAELLL